MAAGSRLLRPLRGRLIGNAGVWSSCTCVGLGGNAEEGGGTGVVAPGPARDLFELGLE